MTSGGVGGGNRANSGKLFEGQIGSARPRKPDDFKIIPRRYRAPMPPRSNCLVGKPELGRQVSEGRPDSEDAFHVTSMRFALPIVNAICIASCDMRAA